MNTRNTTLQDLLGLITEGSQMRIIWKNWCVEENCESIDNMLGDARDIFVSGIGARERELYVWLST